MKTDPDPEPGILSVFLLGRASLDLDLSLLLSGRPPSLLLAQFKKIFLKF